MQNNVNEGYFLAVTEEKVKELLHPGDDIRNFRALCDLFGVKFVTRSSHSGQAILKQIGRYCNYHLKGHQIIIENFKDESTPVVDKRNLKRLPDKFCIPREVQHKGGVYSITAADGTRYIGSTVDFRYRFNQHRSSTNPLCTYEMLKNGAKFELLEIVDDPAQLRIREQYYIQKYKDIAVNQHNAIKRPKIKRTKYKIIKVREEEYDDVKHYLEELRRAE